MDKPSLQPERICQIALVVRDIERSAKTWATLLGMEVPEITETDPADRAHTVYRGTATDARAKLAFLELGPITIELIEPIGGPSVWREALDNDGEGVHHVAFGVEGMEDALTRLGEAGMPTAQRGDFEGGRYAYVDAHHKLGLMLELLESD